MVNPALAVGVLSLGLSLRDRRERREAEQELERVASRIGEEGDQARRAARERDQIGASERMQVRQTEAIERLYNAEKLRGPVRGDKDAFASAVIELADGETAEVTVEAQDGHNLRVKRVYFDRRAGHDYEINVAGDLTSVAHRAVYTRPKEVQQSDRVVATVTNNSGSSTVIDFEMDAWAYRPGA